MTDTTQLMRFQAGIYAQISGLPNPALILLQRDAFSLKSQLDLKCHGPLMMTLQASGLAVGEILNLGYMFSA